MQLIIMRHGQAEGFTTNSDAARQLTQVGQQQAHQAGRVLQAAGTAVEELWVSPYQRAQQTADAVNSSLTVPSRITTPFLTPESNPEGFIAALGQYSKATLMLVSHQPLVTHLIARLCAVDAHSAPILAPASMILLSAEDPLPGCFELVWQRHSPDFVEIR